MSISKFSPGAMEAFRTANNIAESNGLPSIPPELMLLGLMQLNGGEIAYDLLFDLVPIKDLENMILGSLAITNPSKSAKYMTLPLSPELRDISVVAEQEAKEENKTDVGSEHLLLAILKFPHISAGMFLSFYGLTYANVKFQIAQKVKEATAKATAAPKASSGCCGGGCCSTKADTTPDTKDTNKTSLNDRVDAAMQGIKDMLSKAGEKMVVGYTTHKGMVDWFPVLEEALKMADETGMSVPAAFVQASILTHTVYNKEAKRQIRQEVLNDVVEKVLGLTE